MTVALDFTLANNATFERSFTLLDDNSTVIPLAQTAIRMQIRPSADSTTILLTATNAQGDMISITNLDAGIVDLLVSANTLRSIPGGAYVYDIIVQHPSGRVWRPFAGAITLIAGVTELVKVTS